MKRLLMSIDRVNARFCTPKPLDEAREEGAHLKALARHVVDYKAALKRSSSDRTLSESTTQKLTKMVASLKREQNQIKVAIYIVKKMIQIFISLFSVEIP